MQDLNITELPSDLQSLYKEAIIARENSYSPYSHFAVGAAVRTIDGTIYRGCNIENSSFGLCCCAERNAIFAAACAGQRDFSVLCVVAATEEPVSPCGACRQVMSEFKINKIILGNLKGKIKICTLVELLPYDFAL